MSVDEFFVELTSNHRLWLSTVFCILGYIVGDKNSCMSFICLTWGIIFLIVGINH